MAAGINLDATQAKLVRAVIGHTLIKTAAAVAACWLGVGPVALYALSAQWASESAWMCYNWNTGAIPGAVPYVKINGIQIVPAAS